jgi:hypothetical protein
MYMFSLTSAPDRRVKAGTVTKVLCVLDKRQRKHAMAKLTTSRKNAEPNQEFGLPKERKYPMPDASHARNAKARASQMEQQGKLTAADKTKIDTKADKILGK